MLLYTTQNKFCISSKCVCIVFISGKNQTNKHFEQQSSFYLFTKTWKYSGSVFGTDVAGGAQTE